MARRIGVGPRTVRRWHHAYRSGGEAALAPKPASGAPPRLSEQQKSELARALLDGARQAGYANELWTGRRVAELMEWLWRWLKWDKLANYAPATLEELDQTAGEYCAQASGDQDLLRSFIAQSELPLDWLDG